jgi:hypothetical protein
VSSRIEKSWSSFFNQPTIKRKDVTDKEGQSNQEENRKDGQKQGEDKDADQKPAPADRHSVTKAIADLQTSDKFAQTGMRVEMLETKAGLEVRLTHADGKLIKNMSAEDFIKLRDSSVGDQKPRGKILDQKF